MMQINQLKFIDLFSGCGGLSLGLSWSGAQGLFAVERDSMAFETFKVNLIDSPRGNVKTFMWPEWLERRAWSIDDLLTNHSTEIASLTAGSVDLVAGGPPCQGFSFAGRRDPDDPRNKLFTKYLEFVSLVRPRAIMLENVPGMTVAHRQSTSSDRGLHDERKGSYFEVLASRLQEMGYDVAGRIIDASRFGVPQKRSRLIVLGVLADVSEETLQPNRAQCFFDFLEAERSEFLQRVGLNVPVPSHDAISDLCVTRPDGTDWPRQPCHDPVSPKGFEELVYDDSRATSAYQQLMRIGTTGQQMDSMRLARHSIRVEDRFRQIIGLCRQGVRMSDGDRAIFNLKKHRIYPMSETEPAPTLTTLPDDVLHYSEPRILTVREYARLQSFPDWFTFKGKFTTGGDRRTKECPRYTQVGNAVPPLLAMALGNALRLALGLPTNREPTQ